MSFWDFLPRNFEIREKEMETLFTFAFVHFFVLFAIFCLEFVEWSGVIVLLRIFSFLFFFAKYFCVWC